MVTKDRWFGNWVQIDPNEWEMEKLKVVAEAWHDFRKAARWTLDGMCDALGRRQGKALVIRCRNKDGGDDSARTYLMGENIICIELLDQCFNGCDGRFTDHVSYAKGTFVHELAHVWDLSHQLSLSLQMLNWTGSCYITDGTRPIYCPRGSGPYGGTTACGRFSHHDDFAEAVAVKVYGANYDNGQGKYVDMHRLKFVESKMFEEEEHKLVRPNYSSQTSDEEL